MNNLNKLTQDLSLKFPNSSLLQDIQLIKEVNTMQHIKINFKESLEEMVNKYQKLKSPSITCGILTYNEERCIKKMLK
ncbi:hypothetical protein ACT7C1_20730 [Bacillus paranthracis]